MDSIEKRAAQWAAGDSTGISSKAMLSAMLGKPPKTRFCYPSDNGDFGRCMGLLDAVPEYRERLHEMKDVGPEWAALVAHWPELEAMYRADPSSKALYARMKEVLNPIEATNDKLVKIGNGAALYFGR